MGSTANPLSLGAVSSSPSIRDALAKVRFRPQELDSEPLSPYNSAIGIVGGGTAGYLTALAIRALRPELDVTLIESSEIPILGVGEATTPLMPLVLHKILNFPIHDFYRRVKPTWKLGIRFEWGEPGDYYFNFPFEFGHLYEGHLYEGHINNASVLSVLMSQGKGLVIRDPESGYGSLLNHLNYAYHLDNRRFVAYLQQQAIQRGVKHIDCKIVDAEILEDGESLRCLIDSTGRRLRFDLYVDCTGFRSLLIGQKAGSPFTSFGSSLYTDRAVMANVPHDGIVKPYTTAETMDAGWCWNIPQQDSDHRGYVFCSAFCDEEQAVREMRAKNPGMDEPWFLKFRAGRHEHFYKGNVVAFGNAYGFVEPLESSALHLLMEQLLTFLSHFPYDRRDSALRELLNRKAAEAWDSWRWFLAVHYRFNRRLDTPFWRQCRDDVDVSGAQAALESFRRNAPIMYGPDREQLLDGRFYSGFDHLLLGQKVPAEHFRPPLKNREQYMQKVGASYYLAERALPQGECLDLLTGELSHFLDRQLDHPQSWLVAAARPIEQRFKLRSP